MKVMNYESPHTLSGASFRSEHRGCRATGELPGRKWVSPRAFCDILATHIEPFYVGKCTLQESNANMEEQRTKRHEMKVPG